jgi:hypothetical protein
VADEGEDGALSLLIESDEQDDDSDDDDCRSVSIAVCLDKQSCTFFKFWLLDDGVLLFVVESFSSFKIVAVVGSNILDDPASSSFVRNGPRSIKNVPIVPAWALAGVGVEKPFEKSGLPRGDDDDDDVFRFDDFFSCSLP